MTSAAKVGVFMLIILAILGFFILKIEDLSFGRGKEQRIVTVDFDNVAGLDEKSAVRIAGVRKGKVDKIEVLPNGKARVTMKIDDDVPMHTNAVAKVANLGLLGEKYIELDPGTPSAPVLQGNSLKLSQPGTQNASIDQVTNQISAIATDVKAITESLRSVTAGPAGQQRLNDIVENVRIITAQVRELIATNRSNVDATMANVRVISEQLRTEIPRLASSIDKVASDIGGTVGENRQDVREVVENLKGLSRDLRTTTDNLNAITGQVKSGEGTVGKLIYSDEAHEKLTAALTSVESGVNELRNTLGRASRMQLDLGMGANYYAGLTQDNVTSQIGGNSRSELTIKITPDPEKNRFYNLVVADDPKGKRTDKVFEDTFTDPVTGATSTVINHHIKYERDFLLGAQAGWTLNQFGVRLGIIDTTGGFGVDYRMNNRLKVSGEAFDFGKKRDNNPHLRMQGEYIVRRESPRTPALFVTAGIDNPLNDKAFTFGGGIRWRDDDLKYLLSSIPVK
jgi:phospholipid/cholesterol/gamma-HCH transport system substrate-binding protein